jgi:hypothetical protein
MEEHYTGCQHYMSFVLNESTQCFLKFRNPKRFLIACALNSSPEDIF